jgi:hypothetical protein
MNHTPGPWKVDEMSEMDKNGRVSAKISGPDLKAQGHIAHVYAKGEGAVGLIEQQANARLIAAAPEMLEVLETVKRARLKEHAETPESWKALVLLGSQVNGAIAKAKGEE